MPSILAVLLLLCAMAAPAGANGLYTAVVSVPLEGGADANAARDRAVEAAQALALERVLQRLTPRRSHASLPTASGPNVAGYVETVTLLEEGGGALSARITLRAAAVEHLLASLGIEHETQAGPRLVVVPVYMPSETDRVLWSGPNPWLDAWAAHAGDAALVPIVAPYGELGDLQALSTEEAVDGDGPALASLSTRYEADGTVVAVYRPGGPGGEAEVRLSVVALPDWTGTGMVSVPAPGPIAADGTGGGIPAEAVAEAMAAIDRMWLERRIRPSYDGPVSSIEITAVFAGLEDWIRIRHVLDDAPIVERFDVPVVSGNSAYVVLQHYSSLAAVQADLAGAGVIMEPGAPIGASGTTLILRLADAPQPSPQPGYAASGPDPFAPQPSPFAAQASPFAPQGAAPQGWSAPTIAPTVPTLRSEP